MKMRKEAVEETAKELIDRILDVKQEFKGLDKETEESKELDKTEE